MNWRAELDRTLSSIPTEERAAAAGELARYLFQLIAQPTRSLTRDVVSLDHYLKAEEVAERLGVSVKWVYRHADNLGAIRFSANCLRFPESRVTEYVTTCRPA